MRVVRRLDLDGHTEGNPKHGYAIDNRYTRRVRFG